MTDKRQELKDRLLRAFEICDKHITRIEEALCGLKPYFPLDEEKYLNLNSEAVMRLDQFIFRFPGCKTLLGQRYSDMYWRGCMRRKRQCPCGMFWIVWNAWGD